MSNPDYYSDPEQKNPQVTCGQARYATFRADNNAVFSFPYQELKAFCQTAETVEALFGNYGVTIRGDKLKKIHTALVQNTLVMVKGQEETSGDASTPVPHNHYSVKVVDVRRPDAPLQSLIPKS